jgi:membrane protease YdiL (CAAX protease family)
MSQSDFPIEVAPVASIRSPLHRWIALMEVLAVSGIPTQLAIATVLRVGFGMTITSERGLSLSFFAALSFIDTALIAMLIRVFLAISGEKPADVFLGARPVGGEILRGLLLVPVVFLVVAAFVLTLRSIAPWMHTVQQNPLEAFLGTPLHVGIFLLVVVLAGGVREELQRAFILHRFDRHLGGARLGLAVFSVTFGLLHLNQGVDVAVAIGLLGLVWGLIYVRRRSAVLPMANHAGFNAIQVVQVIVARSMGW